MDVAGTSTTIHEVKDEVGVRCQKLFQEFLEGFKEENSSLAKYEKPAKELQKPEMSTLEVSFNDVEKYNQTLAATIIQEYYRLYPFLNKAIFNYVLDLTDPDKKQDLKKKEYYISFVDVPTRHKVRELNSSKIGTLVRISGQVIRTYPVHPELVLGTFICMDCQMVAKNVEQQFKYTIPSTCPNPVCGNRRRFLMLTDKSVFVDFQKIHIQETQAELPRGCSPRAVEIILREEAVETLQAGDYYDFTGTLIVVPDRGSMSGTLGLKAEMITRTRQLSEGQITELHYKFAFLACSVQPTTTKFSGLDITRDELTSEDMRKILTDREWDKVYEMSRDRDLYNNLTNSLFPSVYGNNEVKRGILLMMFGGVAKTTIEGTKLRGDINVCIVGDPSTAKSQLLKQVSEIMPRAIYTSGKASTAAGLTAAVVKDKESQDFVIEAGALMLADNGVCCIDEFDKMELADQVAMHEAMEQQTITIAKAGIRATLNARTSILAAANPNGGRYDRAKSLKQNVTLRAPLMSRFDLFFIMIDEQNETADNAIARMIVDLHCDKVDTAKCFYSREDILRYIAFAKSFKPIITKEAAEMLSVYYVVLRESDGSRSGSFRITVRQLEAMTRLSEALAKMHCNRYVTPDYVREAYRLLKQSIVRVEQPQINLAEDDSPVQSMNVDEETPSNAASGSGTKKKFSLPYEEYKSISTMLIVYMREEENKPEQDENAGMRKSALVSWYLDQLVSEGQIENEDELLYKKILIEKIIDRLIFQDQVIITLSMTGLKSTRNSSGPQVEEDPLLVVHPDYVVKT